MRLKLSLLLLFTVIQSWSQTDITAPGNGIFKVPAGVESLSVECWGAGGGVNGSITGGGGGGGGAYNRLIISVVPKQELGYNVGKGGVGQSGLDGNNGGDTNFSTIVASGGFGGKKGPLGAGGAGGSASGIFSGGSGAASSGITVITLVSGRGGGGAGSTSNGGSGSSGGLGGSVGGGAGGAPVSILSDGKTGNPAGGGGSGGAALLSVGSQKGGDGGNGRIKLTYTCPIYGFTSISATNVCTLKGTSSVVTLTGTVQALPLGDYTVTYDRSNPSGSALIANATVTEAGTLKFTATGLSVIGSSSITVTELRSGSCSNNFSGNQANVVVSGGSVGGSISSPAPICSGSTSGLLTLSDHTGTIVK